MAGRPAPMPVDLPPFQPPAPDPKEPGDLADSSDGESDGDDAQLPVGCELLVRLKTYQPSRSGPSPVKQIEDVVAAVRLAHPDLVAVSVHAPKAPKDGLPLPYVTIGLAPDVLNQTRRTPRPDLLDRCIGLIAAARKDLEVMWCPGKRGDKSLMLRVTLREAGFSGEVSYSHASDVEAGLSKAGIKADVWCMKPDCVGVRLLTYKDVEKALSAKWIESKVFPKKRLSLQPVRQIIPSYAFELIIRGAIGSDAHALDLPRVIRHRYKDTDGNPLLVRSSGPDDEGNFCFVMRDWDSTRRVLADSDFFENKFREYDGLQPPILLYKFNTGIPKRTTAGVLNQMTRAGAAELQDVKTIVRDMERSVNARITRVETSVESLASTVSVVSRQVEEIGDIQQRHTMALLGVSQTIAVDNQKADLSAQRTLLMYELLDARGCRDDQHELSIRRT